MKFYLDNMTCGGCARTVSGAVQSIDAGATIMTDPSTRLVQVQTTVPEEDFASALHEAGFPSRSK
jgi:copper chaperone